LGIEPPPPKRWEGAIKKRNDLMGRFSFPTPDNYLFLRLFFRPPLGTIHSPTSRFISGLLGGV
jgi:hypothetical protein